MNFLEKSLAELSGTVIVFFMEQQCGAATGSEQQTAAVDNSFIVERRMPDSSTTPFVVHRPNNSDRTSAATRGVVIIWPGFGMGARYYRPMALELASRGFGVVVGELRGQGNQNAVSSWCDNWGYQDMASQDYVAAVEVARSEFGSDSSVGESCGANDSGANDSRETFSPQNSQKLPVYLMCHSMGGQIASIYLTRPNADVDGVIGVGSGTPHYVNFTGSQYKRLRYGSPLMAFISFFAGYWPSKPLDFAGYGRQARRHVLEWVRFAQTGKLRPLNAEYNYTEAMKQVTTPVLLTTCDGDHDCPIESANDLARMLPRAAKTEFIDHRLGHNRWAREPKAIADRLEKFIEEIPTWQVN